MYYFKKYEFDSEELFNQLKNNLQEDPKHSIVELGILRNNKYSVDALWDTDFPIEWEPYEIYDIEGNGSHTFLGWEFNTGSYL